MKHLLFGIALLFFYNLGNAQITKEGQVITRTFLAPSIQGITGGEDPNRRLTIYLPPGYNEGTQRYPVIYFLHGYLVNGSTPVTLISWARRL